MGLMFFLHEDSGGFMRNVPGRQKMAELTYKFYI